MSHQAPPELTLRAIVLAIVLAVILAAANAYLGLFAGMTIAETANVLGVSAGTVENDWVLARAWLRRRLGSGPAAGEDGGA